MTPTRSPCPTARRLAAATLATCLALAACVPPAPELAPAPAPSRSPAPSPTVAAPAPVPAFNDWMDAPQTPGEWFYRSTPGGGLAAFGPPQAEALLSLRCDRAAGVVEIVRTGSAGAALPMVIRTETMQRSVDAVPADGALPTIVARVPARDPLLDAMAFSRGRFAVEVSGLAALYVPSYPEVTRVIEDCR